MRMSNLHEFWFTSKDGLRMACKRWDSRGPARGVLQVAHGMGEHSGRNCELIDALPEASFTVYANDHRGHGRTAASPQNFRDFGEGGFALLAEDMVELPRIAKKENPERPLIVFGRNMGSFAAQEYILDHSHSVDGLLLTGSGSLDGLAKVAVSALAKNHSSSMLDLDLRARRSMGSAAIHKWSMPL